MATFCGGQGHLPVRPDPTLAQTYTNGYTSGTNSDITSTVNHIGLDISDDMMNAVDHFSSDTSDEDLDDISHVSSDSNNDMDIGNHIDMENSNDIDTENHKSVDILKDVYSDSHVNSVIRTSDTLMGLNGENSESKKSSTAFIIDFGSESSSSLSISDKLSRFLPRHVAERVELRASSVKIRPDRDKTVDKERLEPRSEISIPGLQGHQRQTRHDTNTKPEIQKSLPVVHLPRIEAPPSQHSTNAQKKPIKDPIHEGKRNSWSSALPRIPSCNNASSFRTPCRKLSCPSSNQSSAVYASSANSNHSTSTDLKISDSVDHLDSKNLIGAKFGHCGSLRSNESYTILNSVKHEATSDCISDSGTYEVDEEQREDIRKARRTISHVFGVRRSPKRSAVKPKRLVQFTRSNVIKQSPVKKATPGCSVNRPGTRISPSSADANKSRIRCQATVKSVQSVGPKGGNSVENLGKSASNNHSRKSLKATTRELSAVKGSSASAGKESRPNTRNISICEPFKSRLCSFGISASDHVVHSNCGKAAVSCPVVQRPATVNLRTNRTFELRCARLEANAAVASNAEKTSLLLQKMRRRIPKLPVDGTQETSSYTSICSRESGNSTSIYVLRDIACTLRELKQNTRQSSCSQLQEEALSPASSSTSVTVDGSYTSLDRAQAKKPNVRKTSSMLAYQIPHRKDKDEVLAACPPKRPPFQDKFALNMPEVRAWHERHRNDQSNRTLPKVLPWDRKVGQMKTTLAKKEQVKRNTTLLETNSHTKMTTACRDSINALPAKNGRELNALKMLLKMSEEITAQLRRVYEGHDSGTILPQAQQTTITNAMISAFKNFLQTKKDIQEIRKALNVEQ